MPRSDLMVRQATYADVPGMVELQTEMRETLGRRAVRSAEGHRSTGECLVVALDDPDQRLVVAVDNQDRVVGLASLQVAPASILTDSRQVHASIVHVSRSARSRGVGRALLVAAAAFAEETGAEHISVDVAPQHREAQRFYVRMGFAPLTVRRIAPVSLLKRRLGASSPGPTVPVIGDTVTSRRGMRARLDTARAVSVARRRAG